MMISPLDRRLGAGLLPGLVGLMLMFAPGLFAAPVTVGDAGFETNSVTAGNWTNNLNPEWKETNGPNDGNAFEEYVTGFSAEGTDHLGVSEGHDVWQDLGVTYQANTQYTLTVAVGNRDSGTNGGNLSTYVLADSLGTEYATASINASTIPVNTFDDAPDLVFDTGSNPAAVGQTVRILLQAQGSGRSHFDDIRLDEVSTGGGGTATVVLSAATGVGTTMATLNAEITNSGVADPTITFFYGTTDGGTIPVNWDHSISLFGAQNGLISAPASSLSLGTTYLYAVRAINSAGTSWVVPPGTFETLANPPTVINQVASGIGATTVDLGADVTDTGGDNPLVTIYYGTSDGGTVVGGWTDSVSLGSLSGAGTANVSGLVSGNTYFFRAHAVNGAGDDWAPSSLSFTTIVVSPATISNRSPNGITGGTASLRGEVDDTGGDVPTVTVFYGPSDEGTNSGAWASSVEVGAQDGDFSVFVSGLSPTTDYWYRCRAQNGAGTSWAGDSQVFQTIGLLPAGLVINEIHYDPEDESTPGEFLELHNPGDVSLDVSGWSFDDGVNFTFPPGTTVAAGGYLVVAEDPATILAEYGVVALGPWVGKLSNDGEQIDLRNELGVLEDQVTYNAGFPWPTGARGDGGSAELIHPGMDGELGGSWRASGGLAQPATVYVAASDLSWSHRKGTSEASSPTDAWRMPGFIEDGTWSGGQTPLGYGDGDDNTVLSDMQGNYSTVYLRRTFVLAPNEIPDTVTVRVYADDGAVVWLNGNEVGRPHAPAGELAFNATGLNHDAEWEDIIVNNADSYLVGGTNVLAVHGLNVSLSSSSDFSIDAQLLDPGVQAGSSNPSPGARNGAYSLTAPPQIRQVDHSPESPTSGQAVTITAKITDPDGVGPVSLDYQLVNPGSYIRKSDAAYDTTWTTVTMVDDGSNGDVTGGDSIFTVVMPGGLQTHRRLVRYRITFEDGNGLQATVPWEDDEQPNFAYYVHDGVASWTGSFTPGGTNSTFTPAVMDELSTYHLMAQEADVIASQYSGSSDGVHKFGTLVYDGEVYDHIEFENRGEASTYVSGKNKWRFHFNRARSFKARDDLGKRYKSDWNRMNFQGCSAPWAAVHRGMAGVEEAVSYRLYELCDVPSPRTHYAHFRVVDEAGEVDPGNQYEGDLWGLYLAVEHPDGSFLNDRNLPDGNVYKIEGGNGDKKEQGTGQPVSSSDWTSFRNDSGSTRTEQWWRDNHDMDAYYSFRAAHRICGNVDIRLGFNHYYYHHPDGHWVAMPWDLDMMFIPETHQAGYIQQQASLNNGALALEFRNRCRELVDLMVSDGAADGGQIGQLIDQYEQIVNPAGQTLTWANLDAYMWNYHPRTNGNATSHSGQSSHKGNFHYPTYNDSRAGGGWTRILTSADHEGSMNYLREYVSDTFTGGTWTLGNGNPKGYGYEYLSQEASDGAIPNKPSVTFTGTTGFPVNDLRFDSSSFSDPQGAGSFDGMRWRIAEIASPGVPGFVVGEPRKYEVETLWDSGEMASFATTVQIPVSVTQPGHTYRVRVRHKDSTGRWSHWSDATEFVAGVADVGVWQGNLVVTELMYHPPEPTGPELAVSNDKNDYEYIEIWNTSDVLTMDLTDLQMADGVSFLFSTGSITSLGPGEYALLVSDIAAFEARYGTGLPVAGQYGGNFANGGEQVVLSLGLGSPIHDFTYGDSSPWPSGADGLGPAMVLIDPESIPDHAIGGNWMAGALDGGTPGVSESPEPGSFAAWRLATFNPAQLMNPAISGVDADYDGDDRSTLLEWALGTDPLTADLPDLEFVWEESGGSTYPAIRFRRPEGTVGVIYELLVSDDLENWDTETVGPISDGTLGGGFEHALLIDDDPENADERYLRIQVRLEN